MIAEVYGIDDINELSDLSKQSLIGSFKFTLGKVVSSKNQELTGKLTGEKALDKSTVFI
jgi:hypothetical protein